MLQILESAPQQQTQGILTLDGLFIVATTLFLYCGHQFGLQRNGKTPRFPGDIPGNVHTVSQNVRPRMSQAS